MASNDPLLLDNQLCFALYSASLAMTHLYKDHLDEIGLTYPQYLIMLILWEQDGVSLKSIADRLGQKSGALTPVIKRMETDGLVKRVRGLENDRTLSIQLTSQGAELKQQASDINRCIADACGLPASELSSLKNQLLDLRKKITK